MGNPFAEDTLVQATSAFGQTGIGKELLDLSSPNGHMLRMQYKDDRTTPQAVLPHMATSTLTTPEDYFLGNTTGGLSSQKVSWTFTDRLGDTYDVYESVMPPPNKDYTSTAPDSSQRHLERLQGANPEFYDRRKTEVSMVMNPAEESAASAYDKEHTRRLKTSSQTTFFNRTGMQDFSDFDTIREQYDGHNMNTSYSNLVPIVGETMRDIHMGSQVMRSDNIHNARASVASVRRPRNDEASTYARTTIAGLQRTDVDRATLPVVRNSETARSLPTVQNLDLGSNIVTDERASVHVDRVAYDMPSVPFSAMRASMHTMEEQTMNRDAEVRVSSTDEISLNPSHFAVDDLSYMSTGVVRSDVDHSGRIEFPDSAPCCRSSDVVVKKSSLPSAMFVKRNDVLEKFEPGNVNLTSFGEQYRIPQSGVSISRLDDRKEENNRYENVVQRSSLPSSVSTTRNDDRHSSLMISDAEATSMYAAALRPSIVAASERDVQIETDAQNKTMEVPMRGVNAHVTIRTERTHAETPDNFSMDQHVFVKAPSEDMDAMHSKRDNEHVFNGSYSYDMQINAGEFSNNSKRQDDVTLKRTENPDTSTIERAAEASEVTRSGRAQSKSISSLTTLDTNLASDVWRPGMTSTRKSSGTVKIDRLSSSAVPSVEQTSIPTPSQYLRM